GSLTPSGDCLTVQGVHHRVLYGDRFVRFSLDPFSKNILPLGQSPQYIGAPWAPSALQSVVFGNQAAEETINPANLVSNCFPACFQGNSQPSRVQHSENDLPDPGATGLKSLPRQRS